MTPEQAKRILKLPERYSTDQLRSAYRAACKAAHPDAGGSATDFHDVKAAYDLLKGVASAPDPLQRFRRKCPTCDGEGAIIMSGGRLGSAGLRKRCPACNGDGLL